MIYPCHYMMTGPECLQCCKTFPLQLVGHQKFAFLAKSDHDFHEASGF